MDSLVKHGNDPSATLRVNSKLTMSGGGMLRMNGGEAHFSTPLDARLRGQDGGDIVGLRTEVLDSSLRYAAFRMTGRGWLLRVVE